MCVRSLGTEDVGGQGERAERGRIGWRSRLNARYKRQLKARPYGVPRPVRQTVVTIGRVVLPAVVAAAIGVEYYDNISSYINANWLDSSSIRFLSSDEIQFIPSFLTVLSLLFSILAGNAYQSLYSPRQGRAKGRRRPLNVMLGGETGVSAALGVLEER